MKKTAWWILIFAGAWACDIPAYFEDDSECDPVPSVCDDTRPTTGDVIIRSSVTGTGPTRLWVYRGDFELNDEILDTSLTSGGLTMTLPVDQYYSVVAMYVKVNGDTIVAIDGDEIDVNSNDYCGGVSCYEVVPANIDVLLK